MGGEPAPEPRRESHFLIETADHTYRLREGANIIGREADVDVCIASEWVSRQHARLQVDGDIALLEDLGSKNGTYVNGAHLTGPLRLHDGDDIRLGRGVVVLRFSCALVATRTESGGASEAS